MNALSAGSARASAHGSPSRRAAAGDVERPRRRSRTPTRAGSPAAGEDAVRLRLRPERVDGGCRRSRPRPRPGEQAQPGEVLDRLDRRAGAEADEGAPDRRRPAASSSGCSTSSSGSGSVAATRRVTPAQVGPVQRRRPWRRAG